jgi:hypothetical protein
VGGTPREAKNGLEGAISEAKGRVRADIALIVGDSWETRAVPSTISSAEVLRSCSMAIE